MVVAAVDTVDGFIVSGPDIISRGFVYVRESEELIEEMKQLSREAIEKCMYSHRSDWVEIKNNVRDSLGKFIYQKTHRKPMILPVIMEV